MTTRFLLGSVSRPATCSFSSSTFNEEHQVADGPFPSMLFIVVLQMLKTNMQKNQKKDICGGKSNCAHNCNFLAYSVNMAVKQQSKLAVASGCPLLASGWPRWSSA